MNDTLCITKTEVKARGWTDSLIRRFLGDPDDYARNPLYRSGCDVCLFARDRVVAAEGSEPFATAKVVSDRRSAAAKKVAGRKRAELLAGLAAVVIEVPVMPRETLVAAACASYIAHKEDRGRDSMPAAADSDPAFLERICVNYVRHELSDYEMILVGLWRKTGKQEGYCLIRQRVMDVIAEAYPWLAWECARAALRGEA